jgi:hypothetical protein
MFAYPLAPPAPAKGAAPEYQIAFLTETPERSEVARTASL